MKRRDEELNHFPPCILNTRNSKSCVPLVWLRSTRLDQTIQTHLVKESFYLVK